jgi:hypothetical protein
MTAQFPDEFIFNGVEYSIAGIHGQSLFDSEEHGLHPVGTCSACWRGYVATFALVENRLVLSRLSVQLGKLGERISFLNDVGPQINGKEPALAVGQPALFNNIYDDLNLPLVFSGGLLIARGFIQELYVHMGFHPAWKFNEVWELIFRDGVQEESRDISLKVAELRKKLTQKPLVPTRTKDHLEWIRDTFLLDY